jgi:phosphate:Na+ symporter
MDVVAVVLGVIGGLALFLYGLYLLSEGLKKVVGEKLKQLLTKVTNNPLKGCAVGALTAAAVHSGLTMVILMGLINAGVLNLTQAMGVMLEAKSAPP